MDKTKFSMDQLNKDFDDYSKNIYGVTNKITQHLGNTTESTKNVVANQTEIKDTLKNIREVLDANTRGYQMLRMALFILAQKCQKITENIIISSE